MTLWQQNYNPLGQHGLSTAVAALPLVVLLGSIGLLQIRIHIAAMLGLLIAVLIAFGVYRMPAAAAVATVAYGAAYGLFPIGWLVLNVMFLYQLTVRRGHFEVMRDSLARVAPDARIQLILIAFSFGALLEGMAGFGAPVAITAAILIQLGFTPLDASGLALLANTAPVAFGSLGIPITALDQVTGLGAQALSAMVGRQLFLFSLVIPFWIVVAFGGWRAVLGVWPAALAAGLFFAVPQLLVSNYHGPWLASVAAGVCSIAATLCLMRVWRPKARWNGDGTIENGDPGGISEGLRTLDRKAVTQAWMPWITVIGFILCWGLPEVKSALDRWGSLTVAVPHLHHVVQRMPPVAAPGAEPEPAEFRLNFLSATGTGILAAAVLSGFMMGFTLREMLRTYASTLWGIRFSLLTIAAMLALGNVTKFSGADATLGLALAATGALYPFFGTLLGWLGVALTGSDTASNVLFGSLQKITAQQLGLNPVLMCAANSAGGVMGKMIDAQSITVASTATNWYGHESVILRRMFFHSLGLAVLMSVLVYLQAHVWPFVAMVPK